MNNFTKDELEQIMHGLYHANIADWPIARKIQSLIDNYCEHERDPKEAPKLSHFTSNEGCVFIVKCAKCGEFYK